MTQAAVIFHSTPVWKSHLSPRYDRLLSAQANIPLWDIRFQDSRSPDESSTGQAEKTARTASGSATGCWPAPSRLVIGNGSASVFCGKVRKWRAPSRLHRGPGCVPISRFGSGGVGPHAGEIVSTGARPIRVHSFKCPYSTVYGHPLKGCTKNSLTDFCTPLIIRTSFSDVAEFS